VVHWVDGIAALDGVLCSGERPLIEVVAVEGIRMPDYGTLIIRDADNQVSTIGIVE
jgi:hypothetical protein